MRLRKRLLIFIALLQSVLFLAHFLLYETWTFSATSVHVAGPLWIKLLLGVLSLTFVPASLLAFRYTNAIVRAVGTFHLALDPAAASMALEQSPLLDDTAGYRRRPQLGGWRA